jgi:hypothetical protein
MDDLDGRLTTLATHLAAKDPESRVELERRARGRRRRRHAWGASIASVFVVAVVVSVLAVRDRGDPSRLRTISPPTASATVTSTVLVVDGGSDQVTVNDLDAGATHTVTLPGKSGGDFPYDVLAADGWIVYPGQNGIRSIRADFSGTPVLLGRAGLFVPSARTGWVWLISATAGGTVQEVRVDGSESAAVQKLPPNTFALVGVPDGLLVGNGFSWWSVWNQTTGQLSPQLLDVNGLIDVHGDVLARGINCNVDSTCDSLRLHNLATGAQRDFRAPAGTTGWIPTAGEGSRDAFSSDGQYLAVHAGGAVANGANHPSDSQVYVINLATGHVMQVPDSKSDYAFSRLAWSRNGQWVFFETAAHSTGAYRPSNATSRSFPANCCGVALASLPR